MKRIKKVYLQLYRGKIATKNEKETKKSGEKMTLCAI